MRMTLYLVRKGGFGRAVVVEERTIYNSGYACLARGKGGVVDLVVGVQIIEIHVAGLKVRFLYHDNVKGARECFEVHSLAPSDGVMFQSCST